MHNVKIEMACRLALVCLIITVHRQIVGPNALSIKIVQATRLVCAINVLTPAPAHVVRMPSVMLLIIRQFARVLTVIQEIRLAAVDPYHRHVISLIITI